MAQGRGARKAKKKENKAKAAAPLAASTASHVSVAAATPAGRQIKAYSTEAFWPVTRTGTFGQWTSIFQGLLGEDLIQPI